MLSNLKVFIGQTLFICIFLNGHKKILIVGKLAAMAVVVTTSIVRPEAEYSNKWPCVG